MGGVLRGRARGTLKGPRDRDIKVVIVAAVLTNREKVTPQMGSRDRNIKSVARATVASGRRGILGMGREGKIERRGRAGDGSMGGGRRDAGGGRTCATVEGGAIEGGAANRGVAQRLRQGARFESSDLVKGGKSV